MADHRWSEMDHASMDIGEARTGCGRARGGEDATPARQEPPRSRSPSVTQGCAPTIHYGPGSPVPNANGEPALCRMIFRLLFALLKSI